MSSICSVCDFGSQGGVVFLHSLNYSPRGNNLYVKIVSSVVYDLPAPVNISFLWNFGSLLGCCLGLQIITGLFLVTQYTPDIEIAFSSIAHIIRDVNFGWVIRRLHANGASFFFFCIFIHIGRGVYYQSYFQRHTWMVGCTILLITIGAAFLGYVLPWGQMSFWGATVITNLARAVPYIGPILVDWLWGGFAVGNATLKRFFILHFLIPFIILALVVVHIIFLHETGSNNPLGVSRDSEKIPFHNYFMLKDLLGGIVIFSFILFICFVRPDIFLDPVNFCPADPIRTPLHIQPEWYFLFAYSILRRIPNKLGGVIALVASVVLLYFLPFYEKNYFRGIAFYPFSRILFWVFIGNFIILTWIGRCPVERPFLEIGACARTFYFFYFVVNPYLEKKWAVEIFSI